MPDIFPNRTCHGVHLMTPFVVVAADANEAAVEETEDAPGVMGDEVASDVAEELEEAVAVDGADKSRTSLSAASGEGGTEVLD